jgi:hypothetical protein
MPWGERFGAAKPGHVDDDDPRRAVRCSRPAQSLITIGANVALVTPSALEVREPGPP